VSHGGDGELPEEHEEHVNHEAWVIHYADLLTLLMAMFIALFAMSTVDITKFKAFAVGFHEALGGGKLDASIGGAGKTTSPVVGDGNGNGPFSGGTLVPNDGKVDAKQIASILSAIANEKQAKQNQTQSLDQVAKQIEDAAKGLGLGGKVTTRQRNDGLEVTLLTDKVLFSSGTAELATAGQPLLDLVASVLNEINNPILINGYTDNRPIFTAQFPSNLYLSLNRAGAVATYFMGRGIDPDRLHPSGQGELHPIASNDTEEGRAHNRRVEIIIQSKLVKQTLDRAGLDDRTTTPTTKPISQPVSGSQGARPELNPGLGAH
jgi:chemotaxis protein MotB